MKWGTPAPSWSRTKLFTSILYLFSYLCMYLPSVQSSVTTPHSALLNLTPLHLLFSILSVLAISILFSTTIVIITHSACVIPISLYRLWSLFLLTDNLHLATPSTPVILKESIFFITNVSTPHLYTCDVNPLPFPVRGGRGRRSRN